jgi:hypothetical protein
MHFLTFYETVKTKRHYRNVHQLSERL